MGIAFFGSLNRAIAETGMHIPLNNLSNALIAKDTGDIQGRAQRALVYLLFVPRREALPKVLTELCFAVSALVQLDCQRGQYPSGQSCFNRLLSRIKSQAVYEWWKWVKKCVQNGAGEYEFVKKSAFRRAIPAMRLVYCVKNQIKIPC